MEVLKQDTATAQSNTRSNSATPNNFSKQKVGDLPKASQESRASTRCATVRPSISTRRRASQPRQCTRRLRRGTFTPWFFQKTNKTHGAGCTSKPSAAEQGNIDNVLVTSIGNKVVEKEDVVRAPAAPSTRRGRAAPVPPQTRLTTTRRPKSIPTRTEKSMLADTCIL